MLALAGIMVLNFENDSQKCAYHVSCEIYQRIFFFDYHHYHNHFVQRVNWSYHFHSLSFIKTPKKPRIPYEHFLLNVFPVLNFRRSLFNNFFYLIIQTRTESATHKLNVPKNVLDLQTDLVSTKSGGGATASPALPPSLCYWLEGI